MSMISLRSSGLFFLSSIFYFKRNGAEILFSPSLHFPPSPFFFYLQPLVNGKKKIVVLSGRPHVGIFW